MKLHVGTSGYAYKEWKGSFYPKDMTARGMLPFYGERFRAVEINASFYRLPAATTLEAWAADVPNDFKFTLKAPQRITHFQRLRGVEESVVEFVKVAQVLEARLGPLLFGLPPNMKKDAGRLQDFLAVVPKDVRASIEFRHASWFDDEVFGLLRRNKVAICIADADDGPEVPFEATCDWGYLRLRREKYTPRQLKAWAERVLEQKWREAYVFFKHEETGTGPKFANTFLQSVQE